MVLYNDYPHEVMERWSVKPGKGGAFTKAKIRKVGTGQSAFEVSWRSGENVELADMEVKNLEYSYVDGDSIVMYDEKYEEVRVPYREDWAQVMVPSTKYKFSYFEGQVVSMTLPGSITMQVVEIDLLAQSGGDRSKMATKAAKLESGLTVQVPEYVKEGDYIRYNLVTEEFMNRVDEKDL